MFCSFIWVHLSKVTLGVKIRNKVISDSTTTSKRCRFWILTGAKHLLEIIVFSFRCSRKQELEEWIQIWLHGERVLGNHFDESTRTEKEYESFIGNRSIMSKLRWNERRMSKNKISICISFVSFALGQLQSISNLLIVIFVWTFIFKLWNSSRVELAPPLHSKKRNKNAKALHLHSRRAERSNFAFRMLHGGWIWCWLSHWRTTLHWKEREKWDEISITCSQLHILKTAVKLSKHFFLLYCLSRVYKNPSLPLEQNLAPVSTMSYKNEKLAELPMEKIYKLKSTTQQQCVLHGTE